MTDKRLFGVVKGHREHITDHTGRLYSDSEVADLLNTVHEENEQLKKDVEYWKQVASQYSNELNVWEHYKKYKTECKDIYHRRNDE